MDRQLPFYFKRINKDKYLISNMCRDFIYISSNEFETLYNNSCTGQLREKLLNHHFITEGDIDSIVDDYRKFNLGIFKSTFLHIFVLTLNCNLNCVYCQAEYDQSSNSFMTKEIAKKSVDIALSSPEKQVTFEFQGGEPLLNFDVLRFIVEYTNKVKAEKSVQYSIVTNAQAMTDDILDFLVNNNVSICVSMDGPKIVHDINRPTKCGRSNFDKACRWFEKAKKRYAEKGIDNKVAALPTITKYSLSYPREIVDFYVQLGVSYISIREISPFGRAASNWELISYSPKEFITFYKKCMDYIIELNLSGESKLKESFSEMILQKILGKMAVNYTDLRSPCGAAIGQIAYNWNGKIYTCDEGRMMSNMGSELFCIGNVFENTYFECINSEAACITCNASCLDANPNCSQCVFNPICGICPVYSFFTQNDLVGIPICQDRCKILQGIYMYIINWIHCSDESKKRICNEWIK